MTLTFVQKSYQGHVLKGQTRDPNSLKAQYLENYLSYVKFGMQLCMGNAERAHKKFPLKVGVA